MYLCVAREAVSAILLRERDSRQVPVFFVSHALQALEINYNSMEKLVLALVHATRRLRRYFQAHPVVVITDQPIKQILSWSKNTRRMLKWKFELEEFDITYRPRTSIRGQILADFITKRPDEECPPMEAPAEETTPEQWIIFTDGSSCLEGSGVILILTSPEGEEFTYALSGINGCKELGSQSGFPPRGESNQQIIRGQRTEHDPIPRKSQSTHWQLQDVLVEILKKKSIEEQEILAVLTEEGYCWMTPLIEYLAEDNLSTDTKKARAVRIKARQYAMINDVLMGRCNDSRNDNGKPSQEVYMGQHRVQVRAAKRSHIQQREAVQRQPSNGQVERANHSLGEGIKARLGEDNKNWVEEVSHVLWAHRTMIKTSNGDTLFSLTYGTEAVIPVEIGMPSLRCTEVNQSKNNEGILLNLDLLEERREKAALREAKSKAKMEKYYNARVCSVAFCPGDFVYRSNEASNAKDSGKVGPKKEGPYEVVEALGRGSYKLRNGSGDILPRTWNVKDLKKMLSLSFHHVSTPVNEKPH
ncbi:reverse transcriptase domain-containing protein [Tanacetum coccineum]